MYLSGIASYREPQFTHKYLEGVGCFSDNLGSIAAMPSELDNHTMLGPLLRYWQAQRGDRRMPARKDIDPLEIGPVLLPHLLLCDLVDHGQRIRYRLVGTNVVRRWGFDPTGRFLDESMSPYFAYLAELNRLVAEERAPIHAVSAFRWGVNRELEAHHLLLPLSKGGTDPAIALIGIAFRSDEVFPPQIRSLVGVGRFEQRRRTVLDLPAEPELELAAHSPSRSVA